MKEHKPMVGGWVEFTTKVKEELGRELTAEDSKIVMEFYLKKGLVEDCVEKLP